MQIEDESFVPTILSVVVRYIKEKSILINRH